MKRRFTQNNKFYKFLEYSVKSNPYIYKIIYYLNHKFLNNYFYEEDLNGLKYLNLSNDLNCIDIGSNIGGTIDLFSKYFNNIYSFEPYLSNYNYLSKKYNDNNKVNIFNIAVHSCEEEKNFYIPYYKNIICMHQSSSFYKNEIYSSLGEFLNIKKKDITFKKHIVKCKKLNDFKFEKIGLIKIDSEGNAIEILKGMNEYLNKDLILIIENSPRNFNQVNKILDNYKFKSYRYNSKMKKFDDKSIENSLNIYYSKKTLIT